MPSINYDRFEIGIDRRKGRRVSDANRLWDLKNAYVTTGWRVRKRPGLTLVKTLTAGSVGLISADGVLNTVSDSAVSHSGGSVTVTNTQLSDVQASGTIERVYSATVYNGVIYASVGFDDPAIEHHYLDGGSGGSRAGSRISDANCPNSEGIIRTASKIFALDTDTVPYTATLTGPWDWTSGNDAGALPTGIRSTGDPQPRMLGLYNELLAVANSDSIQTWFVDPDPQNMSISEIVENTGTTFYGSGDNVSGDLYYLGQAGFESLSTLSLTNNLADIDVGSPIDSIVQPIIGDPANLRVHSAFYQGGGQYWCVIERVAEDDSIVFVYTFSRTAKVSAWSYYTFDFRISDIAELAGNLYLRSGNSVYLVDPTAFQDDGVDIEVVFEMPFQDFKKPGQRKHVHGLDIVQEGSGSLSIAYDARNPNLRGPEVVAAGDSRAGGMLNYELNITECAPRITHNANEAWELEMLELYYDLEGAI